MIVIKSVDFVEVPGTIADLLSCDAPLPVPAEFDGNADCTDIKKEIIKGTKLFFPDGREVVLGVSKQAEEVLGYGYKIFKDQKICIERHCQEIQSLRMEIDSYECKLKKIESMSIKARLICLFKGFDFS